jgi:hypothetical protein
MKIDLNISKDKRAKGNHFHKTPGIKCAHTKKQACADITEECDGFYSINYIFKESLVLNYCKNANRTIRF